MTTNVEPVKSRLASTGIRRLTPDTTKIFEGAFSLLHCAVQGDKVYRSVFAVLMFPIHHPDKYVSLRYTETTLGNDETAIGNEAPASTGQSPRQYKDKIREIGIIDDLSLFPVEVQQLLKRTLAKHYHEQIISRIYEVHDEFGLLFFDVETQRGRLEFIMPWRHDRAEDFGENGKVLLDVSDNRFIIPDVLALNPQDQRRFTGYIYW